MNPHTDDNPPEVTSSEELIGYRYWMLSSDYRLVSPIAGCPWDSPTLTAHELPNATLGCGVHAGKGTAEAAMYCFWAIRFDVPGKFTNYPVVGRVRLSGLVVEGSLGYRAERATVDQLWLEVWPHVLVENPAPVALNALDNYCMPVGIIPKFKIEFPPTVPIPFFTVRKMVKRWDKISKAMAQRYQCDVLVRDCPLPWLKEA